MSNASRANAAPMPEPDARLIALGRDLEAAWQVERDADAYRGSDRTDEAVIRAVEATYEIVARILATRSRSLAGLRVKAQALLWAHDGETLSTLDIAGPGPVAADERLIVSIINDLQMGALQ